MRSHWVYTLNLWGDYFRTSHNLSWFIILLLTNKYICIFWIVIPLWLVLSICKYIYRFRFIQASLSHFLSLSQSLSYHWVISEHREKNKNNAHSLGKKYTIHNRHSVSLNVIIMPSISFILQFLLLLITSQYTAAIRCQRPAGFVNGRFRQIRGNLRLTCNNGYTLIGNPFIRCSPDGSISGDRPVCASK